MTSGKITVNSQLISDFNDKQLTNYRAKEIGFIFQFYNLIPNLNALENIELINDISNNKMDGKKYLKEVNLLEHEIIFLQNCQGENSKEYP